MHLCQVLTASALCLHAPKLDLMLPLYFGLAASVFVSPFLTSFNKVKVRIYHSGAPIPVTLHVREQQQDGKWTYIDASYFPRNLMTSPIQPRDVTVSIPLKNNRKKQVCVRHIPPVDENSGNMQIRLSYQSCASVPQSDLN